MSLKNSSRNPNDPEKPVVIEPVTPSLTALTRAESRKRFRPSARVYQIAGLLLFVCAAVAIFVLVPQRDSSVLSPSDADSALSTETDSRVSGASNEGNTPFVDSQLERARDKAEQTLTEFSQRQDIYERNSLGNDAHNQRYEQIIDRANQGDTLFGKREFDAAQIEYQGAVDELTLLLSDIDVEFSEWMNRANLAFERRDQDAADEALNAALGMKPLEPSVQDGLRRLAVQPQVEEMLRESARATLRGDYNAALVFLVSAERLDPLTLGIDERRRDINAKKVDEDISSLLSAGHAALANEEFDKADGLFDLVLSASPGHAAALTGLQQSERSRLMQKIQSLQDEAEAKEQALDMQGALNVYNEALAIDSTLQFAVDGRQRVIEIVNLTNEMNRILADTLILSADEEFQKAQETLEASEMHRGFSREFDTSIDALNDAVRFASEFLTVVLVSDNATDVSVTTLGLLGAFDRREIELRPGRYEVFGSKDGCVDVRKTITVKPDMMPVSIVCEKPI